MKFIKFFKNYHNIHNDRIAILVGAGPTLEKNEKYFKSAQNNNYLFFGNNDSVFEKNLFELDYFVLCDKKNLERRGRDKFINATAKKEKFYVNYNKRRLLTKEELIQSKGKSFVVHNNKLFENLDDKYFHKSSLFITVQIILIMGIKKIYLAGCDCGGKNYYIEKGSDYTKLINQWKNVKKFRDKYFPDVKIFSINPVNLKNIFPEDPNYFSDNKN